LLAHSLVLIGCANTLLDLADDHVEDFSFGEVAAKGLASSDTVYGTSNSATPNVTWGFWSGDSLGVVDRREGGAQGRHGRSVALFHRVGEGAAQASP
jgi:hypothetical protein